MALAITGRGTNSHAPGGTGTWSTSAFTPSANSLLCAVTLVKNQSSSSDPSSDLTVSDSNGLTWTSRALIGNATSWSMGMRLWTAPVGGSPASGTVTFDCAARNIFRAASACFDLTGYNTGAPVTQTQTDGDCGTNGANNMTALSGSPVSTSIVIAVLAREVSPGAASVVTHGTGWTELYDFQQASQGECLQIQYRTGSTSTTVGWDDVEASGATVARSFALALEVAAAASGRVLGALAGRGGLVGGGLAGQGGGLVG